MNSNWLRWAPLLFLLMWSSGAIFVKLGLIHASVWSFLALRSIGAIVVLVPILAIGFADEFRTALVLPGRIILRVVGIGLLLQVSYQCGYFLAIGNGLSPSLLTIILCAQPLLMPWIAGEQLPRVGKVLLGTGFVGLLITILGAREIKAGSSHGVLYGVIALAAISLGTGWQKRLDIGIVPSILWQYLAAAVVFSGIVAMAGWRATLTIGFLGAAAWMVLIVSVAANVLLLHLLAHYSAAKIGSLFYVVPIITMLADHYLYGEVISALTMLGMIIVVTSSLAFANTERLHFWLSK